MWCFLAPALAVLAAGPNGVDVGWTVDHNTGQIDFTSTLAAQLVQGDAGWVRVEMSLVKGHTNWDSTMLGYYDTVVNNATAAGLQVLMLIDGGSWPGSQSDWCSNNFENHSFTNGDNPYIENYATNAVLPLVQHFRGRVKVYELWNEPNCWTSNPSNGVYTGATYVYPSNFGWLLARSWEAVHGTGQINDVTLFSGGLFGLDISGQNYSAAGGQYLDDTYSTGTNLSKGGSFAHTKSHYAAYPLDGVGEHIYLTPGSQVTSNEFRQYEDWVHQALTKYEGTNSPKKTFITEFGWQTTNAGNSNGVSQALQDTNLATGFRTIQATPYVRGAIWFQWADNPAGGLWYGVVDSSGQPKLSYPDFQKYEQYVGILSNGTTNVGIQTNYLKLGQAAYGDPIDNGNGPWVYAYSNGYAQDFFGGSHSNVTLFALTNGNFELNDLDGFWSFIATNSGTNFGYPLTSAYSYNGGLRQDFAYGYLTWNPANQVLWHPVNNLLAAPGGLSASGGNQQVSLQWNSAPTANSYNVYAAAAANGPFTLQTTVVGPPQYTDAPLANGTPRFYTVSAVNTNGEGPTGVVVNATPEAVTGNLGLWQDTNIGSVNLSGEAGWDGTRYYVYGNGTQIGGNADNFDFLYQAFSGDGAIEARITSLQNTDPWAQGGVMMRESLGSNSTFVMLTLTPGNGIQLVDRTVTGAAASDQAGPAMTTPAWLMLTRTGTNFTAAVSSDGTHFSPAGAVTINMASNYFVGLAVCSHNTNELNTTIFNSVTVRPLLCFAPSGVLNWSGTYVLQRATNVNGPYFDLTNAASPFLPTNGPTVQFFRLRN